MRGAPRFRRRDLGPLAAAAFAAWAVPAWAQDGGGDKGGGGAAPGAGSAPPAKKKKTVVDSALEWLKRHQDADGRWNSAWFTSRCSGAVCTGAGETVANVRTSGLALFAFLGAGETHQSGEFKETVKEGLKYLRNVQDVEGCFGARVASCWLENHLAAAIAMVETYGMTQSVIFKDSARRGVEFALRVLDPAKGFRSDLHDAEPTAAEVGDLVLLLRSAHLAELLPDRAPLSAAGTWFDDRFDAKTLAMRAPDPKAPPDPFAADDLATYAGLARVWCPADVATVRADPLIPKLADRLASKPPLWAPSPKGKMSFAAWERRSQFLFQAGGKKHIAWCRALVDLLVAHIDRDGCADGSWAPVDVDSARRGRAEATARCALANEVWYRYGRRTDPPKADTPPAPPAPAPAPSPAPSTEPPTKPDDAPK